MARDLLYLGPMMRFSIILVAFLTLASASCKNRHKVAEAEKEMESLSTEGNDSTVVNDAFADLESDFDFDVEEDTIDDDDGLQCKIHF